MVKSDVIVMGNGAMGSAICYYLSLSRLNVVGIDRFSPPHQQGSSGGNARIFRQIYFEDPQYIPLAKRAYSLWKEISVLCGKELLSETGLLVLSSQKEKIAHKISSNAKAHEVEIEILDHNKIKNRFPQFSIPSHFTGLLEAQAGFLRPERSIEVFLTLARQNGAQFKTNEKVLYWEKSGTQMRVVTENEEYQADYLILSPGPWAPELLDTIPMKFKIARVPQFWFKGTAQHSHQAKMPCFAFAEDGRLIYGFPEIDQSGIKIADYAPSSQVDDPLAERAKCSEYREEELEPITEAIHRFLPDVLATPLNWKICFYTLTKDQNFLIDFHPDFKNVILATGGSGHAFKFAPLIGELVSKMVNSQRIDFDLDFLQLR